MTKFVFESKMTEIALGKVFENRSILKPFKSPLTGVDWGRLSPGMPLEVLETITYKNGVFLPIKTP